MFLVNQHTFNKYKLIRRNFQIINTPSMCVLPVAAILTLERHLHLLHIYLVSSIFLCYSIIVETILKCYRIFSLLRPNSRDGQLMCRTFFYVK